MMQKHGDQSGDAAKVIVVATAETKAAVMGGAMPSRPDATTARNLAWGAFRLASLSRECHTPSLRQVG